MSSSSSSSSSTLLSITAAQEVCRRGTKAEVVKVIKRLKDKDRINEKDQDYEQTVLHILSENGRLDLCIYAVDKCRAGVNEVDKSGWTPLHSAASAGHIDVLEALLQRGAFARALTDEQASPLHYFVRNSCSDPGILHRVISAFVAKGADLNQKNKHGESALHQAALRGRSQCVLCLLNFKADANSRTTYVWRHVYRTNHQPTNQPTILPIIHYFLIVDHIVVQT
jgi:ankyrin repeat protein